MAWGDDLLGVGRSIGTPYARNVKPRRTNTLGRAGNEVADHLAASRHPVREVYTVERLERRLLLHSSTPTLTLPFAIFQASSSLTYTHFDGAFGADIPGPVYSPQAILGPTAAFSSGDQSYHDSRRDFTGSVAMTARQSGPNDAQIEFTGSLKNVLTVNPPGGVFGGGGTLSSSVTVYIRDLGRSVNGTIVNQVTLDGTNSVDGSNPKPLFNSPQGGNITGASSTYDNSITYQGATYYALKGFGFTSGLNGGSAYSNIFQVQPGVITGAGSYTTDIEIHGAASGAVSIDSISTKDSKSLEITYHVTSNPYNAAIGNVSPIPLTVYRSIYDSVAPGSSVDAVPIAGLLLEGIEATPGTTRTVTIDPLSVAERWTFNQSDALRPDPLHKYVVAVADENGVFNPADVANPPQASFRIWLLGAITHGYAFSYVNALTFGALDPHYDQALEDMRQQLANQKTNGEGSAPYYDRVVAEHWEISSVMEAPYQAVNAGLDLAKLVEGAASGLPGLSGNDVVDVNFIGHSRGAVVISVASAVNYTLPQLAAGFMMETFVDPHPANPTDTAQSEHHTSFSQLVLNGTTELNNILLTKIAHRALHNFYSAALDPDPWIPQKVQAAVDFYQQTDAAYLPTSGFLDPVGEGIQNLQGMDPNLIHSDGAALQTKNMSAFGVGHHEIFYDLFDHQIVSANATLSLLGLMPFSNDPLVVSVQPPPTVTAGVPFGLTVTAQNSDGTVNISYNGPVTVSEAFGMSLGGTLTVNAVNGVASFAGLTETAAGSFALRASAVGLPNVETNSFLVKAAAAAKLQLSTPTMSPFSMTVKALDAFGNLDTSYGGSVVVSLSSNPWGAVLGGPVTATAASGVATLSGLTISKLGAYVLSASGSGSLTGSSASFTIVDQLVLTTPPPSTVQVGVPFGFVVKAEDGAGKVDTSYSDQVTAYNGYDLSVSLGGTLSINAVNGVATFTNVIELQNVGHSEVLGAYDNSALPYPFLWATAVFSNPFAVAAGPATSLSFDAISGGSVTTPFSVTVSAHDAFGNAAPTFNGAVTVSLSNDPTGAALGGILTVQATNGVADFQGLTLNKVGTGYTLQARAVGVSNSTSAPFAILEQLVVATPPPASIAAGDTFGTIVSCESAVGVVDTSFQGKVTIAAADEFGSVTLGGILTVNAVNGVATFTGLSYTQSDSLVLSASADGTAGVSMPVTVTPARAVKLNIVGPANSAGDVVASPFALTVQALTQFGTVDTSFTGTITVSLADNPNNAALSGTTAVQAVSGVAQFNDLMLGKFGTGYTLQAIASGLLGTLSPPFVSGQQAVVTSDPLPEIVAGAPFGLVVTAADNLAAPGSSYVGSITLTLQDLSEGV